MCFTGYLIASAIEMDIKCRYLSPKCEFKQCLKKSEICFSIYINGIEQSIYHDYNTFSCSPPTNHRKLINMQHMIKLLSLKKRKIANF